MIDETIDVFIRNSFYYNYESLQYEGGHKLSPDNLISALNQVLMYWRKLNHIAINVTDTEVRLCLSNEKTKNNRSFNIEGIVDIIRDQDKVIMYDIKTHDSEEVRANSDNYETQLNVYAYIWKILRQQSLDEISIICTSLPEALKNSILINDLKNIESNLKSWNPIVTLDFDLTHVQNTIEEFKTLVDKIEDHDFNPRTLDDLKTIFPGSKSIFAVNTCRNCDVRFTCSSYRTYAFNNINSEFFKMYYNEDVIEEEIEEWFNATLNDKIDSVLDDE